MALVCPNNGEVEMLDKMLKDALSVDEDYIMKLYSNDYTPDQSTVSGSLTEANFTNYAAVTLTRAGWNSAVTVSNKAEASYGSAPQSWTAGSSQSIYGYYVEGATSGTVLWAEKFAQMRSLSSDDVLSVQPKFTLNSEN